MARRRFRAATFRRAAVLLAVVPIQLFGAAASGAARGPWTSRGPEGGVVLAFAAAPSDPATLWAGVSGGLFKSTDRGASWARQSPGLTSVAGRTNLTPLTIAVDPSDPATLYAGTSGDLDETDGVLKSSDGGATWVRTGLFGRRVLSLALDPARPSTVYAGVGGGLFKSTDGGRTWVERSRGIDTSGDFTLVTALAIDPADPSLVYAGTEPFDLFKSTDGGDSWFRLDRGLPPQGGSVNALAIDPARPATVYAVANNIGFFRSSDAGATWSRVGGIVPAGTAVAIDVAIHPVDGTVFAALENRVFRSLDGGARWIPGEELRRFHLSAFAVDPDDPKIVYAGSSQGLGIRKSDDAGASWAPANRGLRATSITALAERGSVVYIALQGGPAPVAKSVDGGRTWTPASAGLTSPALCLAIDPADVDTVYAGTFSGVFKTTDGGVSWRPANLGAEAQIRTIAFDPGNSLVLYAGAQDSGPHSPGGVFKSTDGGRSWAATNAGLTDRNVGILAVADPATIYAGTFGGGGVFKSTDAGASWTAVNDGLGQPDAVQALAVDPANPSTIYAGTFGDGVFKTTDGAGTWFPANNGLNDPDVRALVVDPTDSSIVFAGTFSLGVFRSTDAGASWRPFNDALAQRSAEAVVIDEAGNLLAGTNGGGVWSYGSCASEWSLCLNRDRFRVEATWRDFEGRVGSGRVVLFPAADSGLFWFFRPDNWEVLVKALDGCGFNRRFWVFSAAVTNVEYTLRVTDVETGRMKEYFNPLGRSAPAITDIDAFASCPPR